MEGCIERGFCGLFCRVTTCLGSHRGPRTLVTDAELDFEELSKETELQWGETADYKTGLGFKIFDKRVPWHIGRETPS